MNATERVLSDAADYVETLLAADDAARVEIKETCDQGQKPNVTRPLGHTLPGHAVIITFVSALP